MGEVYRATDTVLGRTVAIKLLADRYARDPDIGARFRREALAAARLSGEPHVITVFDVGEHEGRPFIVMEFVEGGSLHDRMRTGRVDTRRGLEWLAETGEALDAAHSHGVVHRDVKPANLLLDREEAIRVSDFGIASATGLDTLTLPGTVLGTVGYLSPEQARGEQATSASDRYALGVVAFELFTGRRPFASDTAATEALGHLNAPVPSAEAIAPDLPAGVDAVFARALSKEPSRRPETCAELVGDLRNAFRATVAPTLPDATVAPTLLDATVATQPLHRRVRPRARPAASVAVGVTLLVTGLGVAVVLSAASGGGDPARTVTQVKTVVSTVARTEPEREDGAALNDAGFARMQAGDYAEALPLLERAAQLLEGSGSLAEAYASYNLAFTRFALGRCDGVLSLLDRSEEVQGERVEIDRLRDEARRICEDHEPGRGNGKGRGKGDQDD